MADYFTVNGVPYPVDSSAGAGEQAREYAGSLKRAFDNTLRNMTRSAKRVWQVPIAPITQTQWETLDAATSLRQSVTVAGLLFGATPPAAAIITATSAPLVRSGESHLRTALLTVQEV